jgi:hypothetical protein
MVSIIQLLNISWTASSHGRAHQQTRLRGSRHLPISVRPTAENDPNGSDEDDHLKPGGLFAGVARIETYTQVIAEIIATTDLPQPGDAPCAW